MKQKDEIVFNNAIFPKVDVENILQKQEQVIYFFLLKSKVTLKMNI